MSEEAKDLELFHYGVKGMRWGVTRPIGSDGLAEGKPPGRKKRLKSERDDKINAVNKKFGEVEDAGLKDFEEKRKANRSSGQGRIEARKNAFRDSGSMKEKELQDLDDEIVYANRDYKKGMNQIKEARSADRAEVRSNVKKNFDVKNTTGKVNSLATSGGIAAGILVGGPAGAVMVANASAGVTIARSAGYSRGKSAIIGIVGGAPGALLASEIAVRQRADRGN